MNLRLFAVSGVVLAGAAGLQAIEIGGGLAALLAAPAAAAEQAEQADAAAEGEHAEAAAEAQPEVQPGPESAPQGAPPGPASFPEQIGATADQYRVLISLQQRRQELESWAAEIDTRALLVESAEARVAERLAELHGVRDEIQDLLGQLDEQEETRIASLVSTYEKMDAGDSARILAALQDDTAILVLSRMKAQNLGDVLGEMETDDAMRITEMLAARADTADVVGDIEALAAEDVAEGAAEEAVSDLNAPTDTAAAGETAGAAGGT